MGKKFFVLLDDKKITPGAKVFTEKNEALFNEWNQKGWGVYVSVNEFSEARKIEFCTKLRFVYADLDIAKAGDGQTREQRQAKKAILLKALIHKCEPNLVIDTSNGLQPLWELSSDSSEPTDENKANYTKVIKGIVEWSKQYDCKADNVYDCSRILRLPGYYHQKEEPYLCDYIHKSKHKYSLFELEMLFPYEEKVREIKESTVSDTSNPIFNAIQELNFQDLIKKAFASVGRPVSFDESGHLIDPIGGTTGTFIGRKGNRDYLASSSHEPFKGNRITAVADILKIDYSDAYKWIIKEYNLDYKKLVKEKKEVISKMETTDEDDDVLPMWKVAELNPIGLGDRYSTGYEVFDNAIDKGFYGGSLVIISAPTAMGKTSFAQCFTSEFCSKKLPTLWFSYEIPSSMLWQKFESMGLNKENLLFMPKKNTTGDAGWIETKIKEAKLKYNIKFAVIDHLGFLLPKTKIEEAKNYSSYLGQICRDLKTIALQEDIIIILATHMRKTEDPNLNDIAHSVGIAQEADFVFTMSREINTDELVPEYYTPYTEITLAKNRIGHGNPQAWFTMVENKFVYDNTYIPQKFRKKKGKSNFNSYANVPVMDIKDIDVDKFNFNK